MHAHTGVKTHLIGPGDARMVARVDRWSPIPCQRQGASVGHGSDGRVERRAGSRAEQCPMGYKQDL